MTGGGAAAALQTFRVGGDRSAANGFLAEPAAERRAATWSAAAHRSGSIGHKKASAVQQRQQQHDSPSQKHRPRPGHSLRGLSGSVTVSSLRSLKRIWAPLQQPFGKPHVDEDGNAENDHTDAGAVEDRSSPPEKTSADLNRRNTNVNLAPCVRARDLPFRQAQGGNGGGARSHVASIWPQILSRHASFSSPSSASMPKSPRNFSSSSSSSTTDATNLSSDQMPPFAGVEGNHESSAAAGTPSPSAGSAVETNQEVGRRKLQLLRSAHLRRPFSLADASPRYSAESPLGAEADDAAAFQLMVRNDEDDSDERIDSIGKDGSKDDIISQAPNAPTNAANAFVPGRSDTINRTEKIVQALNAKILRAAGKRTRLLSFEPLFPSLSLPMEGSHDKHHYDRGDDCADNGEKETAASAPNASVRTSVDSNRSGDDMPSSSFASQEFHGNNLSSHHQHQESHPQSSSVPTTPIRPMTPLDSPMSPVISFADACAADPREICSPRRKSRPQIPLSWVAPDAGSG